MNRLICTNREAVRLSDLPPPKRQPGEPVRVLFVNSREFGFRTTAQTLTGYTEQRDDIDAVHFSLILPKWLRVACARSPIRIGGWDFHGVRLTRACGLALRRWIGGAFPLERFDVVHIFTRERAAAVLRFAGRTPTKFVVNIDTTMISWDRDYGIHRPAPKLDYAIDRKVLARADAVACASQWVIDSCINDYGLEAQRLFLHRPCVRRPADAPVREHDPSRNPALVRIGFVGNNWVRKGGDRLLGWHQARWADRAELHVCSREAAPQADARNVIWHGQTAHERIIREILPMLDMVVIPTWEDTFLIAALEAQLAGLPVVSTRMAGIPEVVLDGRTGFLCRRTDDAGYVVAVEKLLDDPALRARMGRAAAAHADANMDADTWHHHLLDQLVALANGKPVRREPDRKAGVTAAAS